MQGVGAVGLADQGGLAAVVDAVVDLRVALAVLFPEGDCDGQGGRDAAGGCTHRPGCQAARHRQHQSQQRGAQPFITKGMGHNKHPFLWGGPAGTLCKLPHYQDNTI